MLLCSAEVELGPDSILDEDVQIGYPTGRVIADQRTSVGPRARLRSGTIIYAGSRIGADLQTGHGVIIREENVLGDQVNIWNSSTIDYGCRIGHRVRIHCNCYVAQFTTIEDDVFLAPGVTIANDFHPGCLRARECMRGPTIERGARIGAGAVLLPYVVVGQYALVGAGSTVTRDVPARAVVFGNPARVVGTIDGLRCKTGLVERPYGEE